MRRRRRASTPFAGWRIGGTLIGLLALLLNLLGAHAAHGHSGHGVMPSGFAPMAEVCTSEGMRAIGAEEPASPGTDGTLSGCDHCLPYSPAPLATRPGLAASAPDGAIMRLRPGYRGPATALAVWPDTRPRAPPERG